MFGYYVEYSLTKSIFFPTPIDFYELLSFHNRQRVQNSQSKAQKHSQIQEIRHICQDFAPFLRGQLFNSSAPTMCATIFVQAHSLPFDWTLTNDQSSVGAPRLCPVSGAVSLFHVHSMFFSFYSSLVVGCPVPRFALLVGC